MKKETIMVTGAGGFLGRELLRQIMDNTDYNVIAITSQSAKLYGKFGEKRLTCYDFSSIQNDDINWKDISIIVHSAFARSGNGKELADSLEKTKDIVSRIGMEKGKGLVNISSQGVYGQTNKPLWRENIQVAPDSMYALAKYSSELITSSIKGNNFSTNLRLPGLTGGQEGLRLEVVSKFVNRSINKETINIIGGKQVFSNMDVRDAVSGIIALIKTDPSIWKKVYNVGCNKRYSIMEIANIVREVAKDYGIDEVEIKIEKKDIYLDSGMDSSLFYQDTGWMPKYSMTDIVKSLFEYFYDRS